MMLNKDYQRYIDTPENTLNNSGCSWKYEEAVRIITENVKNIGIDDEFVNYIYIQYAILSCSGVEIKNFIPFKNQNDEGKHRLIHLGKLNGVEKLI